jgi:putative transposase
VVHDGSEIALDAWAAFASDDVLDHAVMERMLAGVATRGHADVGEPLGPELEARDQRRWPLGRVAALPGGW